MSASGTLQLVRPDTFRSKAGFCGRMKCLIIVLRELSEADLSACSPIYIEDNSKLKTWMDNQALGIWPLESELCWYSGTTICSESFPYVFRLLPSPGFLACTDPPLGVWSLLYKSQFQLHPVQGACSLLDPTVIVSSSESKVFDINPIHLKIMRCLVRRMRVTLTNSKLSVA